MKTLKLNGKEYDIIVNNRLIGDIEEILDCGLVEMVHKLPSAKSNQFLKIMHKAVKKSYPGDFNQFCNDVENDTDLTIFGLSGLVAESITEFLVPKKKEEIDEQETEKGDEKKN